MRRVPLVFASVALLALLAGCGGSDSDGAKDEGSTTTTAIAMSDPVEMGDPPIDAAGCARYTTLTQLFDDLEVIAGGANSTQVAADTELAAIVEDLRSQPGADDDEVAAALDTIGEVTFQVSESAEGPSAGDRDDALATLSDAFSATCSELAPATTSTAPEADGSTETTAADAPTECPAPETLEAEGYTCDSEGNLTPVAPTECPAPETLEAEGYTCDSEGNLTPIEGETTQPTSGGTVAECPAPEVLESEGYTCDSEGNLTPVG